jgi:hypothetical protein
MKSEPLTGAPGDNRQPGAKSPQLVKRERKFSGANIEDLYALTR